MCAQVCAKAALEKHRPAPIRFDVLNPMRIPWESLDRDTLDNLISEFVTRDGTDYGHADVTLESKTGAVWRALQSGEAVISFDEETETVTILSKEEI